MAVARDREPPAEVLADRDLRRLAKQHLELLDARAVVAEPRPRDCNAVAPGAAAASIDLGVAQVDEAVGLEARIDRDVEQTAMAAPVDGRQAAHRYRDLVALRIHDAQAARALGHQQAAVGHELHAPGQFESGRVGAGLEGGGRGPARRVGGLPEQEARAQQAGPQAGRQGGTGCGVHVERNGDPVTGPPSLRIIKR